MAASNTMKPLNPNIWREFDGAAKHPQITKLFTLVTLIELGRIQVFTSTSNTSALADPIFKPTHLGFNVILRRAREFESAAGLMLNADNTRYVQFTGLVVDLTLEHWAMAAMGTKVWQSPIRFVNWSTWRRGHGQTIHLSVHDRALLQAEMATMTG